MRYLTIVMAGPGGCGKTTTSQTFALGEPREYKELRTVQLQNRKDERDVHWTVYDNCALAGNHASGTDANVGPDVVRQSYEECLMVRRIAIVDGYMSTPRWVEMINDWDAAHPNDDMIVLVVYFHIGLEELIRRLAERLDVPVDDEFIAKKTDRCLANLKRPVTLMKHFENMGTTELWVLDVNEDDDPDTIVDMIDEYVYELLGVDMGVQQELERLWL